jgi:hypothetical protein
MNISIEKLLELAKVTEVTDSFAAFISIIFTATIGGKTRQFCVDMRQPEPDLCFNYKNDECDHLSIPLTSSEKELVYRWAEDKLVRSECFIKARRMLDFSTEYTEED